MSHMRLAKPLMSWFEREGRALPWRAEGFSAWGILVSEFMLQQTPVSRVVPKLSDWLTRWPTPADLAGTSPAEALRAWGRLGYPRRALWLHQAAVQIVQRHRGEVPRQVDDLLALKGVGSYTAHAVAAFAFGLRVPVVDTNTRRVLARAVAGRAQAGPSRGARERAEMMALLPDDDAGASLFNAAMMELGATVCTARAWHCTVCPIARQCNWRLAGYPDNAEPARRQARYEGSDRQARGAVLAHLREAPGPVAAAELARAWPNLAQRSRALAGLLADGLIERAGRERYRLPE